MFGIMRLEIALFATYNGIIFADLLVAETGMIEFDVSCGWNFVEMVF